MVSGHVRVRSVAAILAAVSATRAVAATAPLADRIPADALAYAGWSGADGCPGYSASHLHAVIGQSTLPAVFTSFVPQLVRRVGRLDGHAGDVLDSLVEASAPAWHHPSAFYFGGVDLTGEKPAPKLALLCDAGADAPALGQQLNGLIDQLPPDAEPRPTATVTNGLVVLSLGSFVPPGTGGRSLAQSADFTAALAQCKPDGAAIVGYLDVQAVVVAVNKGVAQFGDRNTITSWDKARDALGLDGFRRVATSAGFEGKDWVERTFASTDGTHAGLLGLLDARPLDADLLAIVPQAADRMAATRLDLAAGFDAVHDAVGQFSADAARQVDQRLAQVDAQAGMDVRRDLLGSLGDQWVTYSDRSVGGASVTGSVLVNKLRDAARGDAAMTQLSRRLNFIIARQLKNPNVEIQFREQPAAGTTLHYLAVPLFTPTWAVKNGYLYVGLYPQVVAAAIDSADRKGPSILKRPELTQLMQRLGNHPAASIAFTDLPHLAPEGYVDLLGESRLLLGIGDVFGAHPPVMEVPPLRQVVDQLEPAGAVTWADAAGWHSQAVSPFPGAEVLGSGGGGGGGLTTLLQLPSLLTSLGGLPGVGMQRWR